VKWHDGCPFTADDVLWNLACVTDQKVPQFYTLQMALSRTCTTNFESIEKVDDSTVALTTKVVESMFPRQGPRRAGERSAAPGCRCGNGKAGSIRSLALARLWALD
jgi:hypothetical protein